jgi:putative methionine-R-sulfoxide reductase with GAF domain/PAS domain-containing protein
MDALADVQVVHEELRVAEDEMRAQQEQITELLVQHDAERRWRSQLAALVPVGLCVTDGNGALVDVNPAMATHLGTALNRLRGKPLSVYLEPADVRRFRDALHDLSTGAAGELRLAVTLRPRDRAPRATHLFGFAEQTAARASAARVQWVLVPEEPATGERAPRPASPAGAGPGGAAGGPMAAAEVVGLAAALSELSTLPVGERDRQRLLGRMATLVRGAVPGAEWVSITLGSPLDPQRLGSDSVEAQEFDGRQLQAGEGPCLDAYTTGAVVLTDDVSADPRWPVLARDPGAVRSVLAVPVRDDGQTTGAVNVYSSRAASFGDAGRRIAEVATAAVASVLRTVAEREAMENLAAGLERALTSRAVIDQAKGMIMARLGVDADDAFARLVHVSSRLNVKVRDLATLVVEGHVDAVLDAAD